MLSKNSREIHYSRLRSPLGELLIAATEQGLYRVHFHGAPPQPAKNETWVESRPRLRAYEQQLCAYFAGELREFTCPLDLTGTPFQNRCWEALRLIPYGSTRTYAEVAKDIGHPKAYRAVGQANHDNPVPIVVPCHRVIGASGSLTGFGGGLDLKEKLLSLEAATVQQLLPFAANL
ncbi:MAG: methylated-DNA--[protein]-cysteine S-methyltransferase [Candidatus Angelobacter sp.]